MSNRLVLNKGNAPEIRSPSERARALAASRNAHLSQPPNLNGPPQHPNLMHLPNSFPPNRGRGPTLGGLAARRTQMAPKLNQMSPPPGFIGGAQAAGLGLGRPAPSMKRPPPVAFDSPFANLSKIVDPSGKLNFSGKAVLHADGVNFSGGASFSINMNQLELQEELGRGNYGTVKRVLHKPTNVAMAMKEIRLQLDNSGLQAILMELDILHNSAMCPQIVEFYGAFFVESCVYYCMEYMDAGSLDKLVNVPPGHTITRIHPPSADEDESVEEVLKWEGVPEEVLAQIAEDMVRGLKFLKEQFEVMHRDVKPTNVLINLKGQIKLCDFGVSGQLNQSLAKTNIGCQSYMAPERIHAESQNNEGTYTVSADVWSLGLSIIEAGIGTYPYPPHTYENVFAQLTEIVNGDPPELPDTYSQSARHWVQRCVAKRADERASYKELLEHPWLKAPRTVDMKAWVNKVYRYRMARSAAANNSDIQRVVPTATVTSPGHPTDTITAKLQSLTVVPVQEEVEARSAPPTLDDDAGFRPPLEPEEKPPSAPPTVDVQEATPSASDS